MNGDVYCMSCWILCVVRFDNKMMVLLRRSQNAWPLSVLFNEGRTCEYLITVWGYFGGSCVYISDD